MFLSFAIIKNIAIYIYALESLATCPIICLDFIPKSWIRGYALFKGLNI